MAAAKPFPIEAKRALRPSRSPSAAWPATPRLIATMTGPSTQLAAACSARAAITTAKLGHSAIANALALVFAGLLILALLGVGLYALPIAPRRLERRPASVPPGLQSHQR